MDVVNSSAVEGELDNFISRRHEKRVEEEGERLAEEMWAEDVGRIGAASRRPPARGEPRRVCKYHQDQAARHRAILETLAAYHESEATKLQRRDDAVVEGG